MFPICISDSFLDMCSKPFVDVFNVGAALTDWPFLECVICDF